MNAADILKYGNLTLLGAIDGLPEANWNTGGVCGVWSVKDVIGHLGAYEHLIAEVLGTFTGLQDTPYLKAMAAGDFNDDQAAKRKNNTIQQVLAEYNDTHARVVQLVPKVSAEMWRQVGTLPWYGMEYALDDYIVYSQYGHKREHAAQIMVFRDSLK